MIVLGLNALEVLARRTCGDDAVLRELRDEFILAFLLLPARSNSGNLVAELVNTEELAHCLQDGGIDITHDEVLSWLRSRGYLISDMGERRNSPSDLCLHLGLMEQQRSISEGGGGSVVLVLRTMLTRKGWEYIYPRIEKYLRQRDEP